MSYQYIKVFLLQTFVTICLTTTLEDSRFAQLLDYHLERAGTGHYFFRFASSDGVAREEEGNLLDENSPDSPVIVKGSYSFPDETGRVYTVRYLADENGFHPEGDHFKVPAFVNNPSPQIVIQSTPGSLQFLPTTLRPQTPAQLRISRFSSTPRPELVSTSTVETSTSGYSRGTKSVTLQKFDGKNSLVNLLSNNEARGFSLDAASSL